MWGQTSETLLLFVHFFFAYSGEAKFPNMSEEDLQSGLLLIMDLNEDKQYHSPTKHEDHLNDNDIIKQLSSKADEEKMKLYIKTIGPFTTLLPIYSNLIHLLEPLKLYGEGSYILSVVKEVKVTEDFMTLDEETRGCQMTEPYENCTTRVYKETVLEECGCIPFSIWMNDRVRKCSLHQILSDIL